MNKILEQKLLDPIVKQLKKNCSGSDGYLSGINDGGYTIGEILLRKVEKAFIIGYMNKPDFNSSFVDEVTDGKLKDAWENFIKNWDNL